MKIVKALLKIVFTILLVCFITTLVATEYLKKIVTEDFIGKVAQETIANETANAISSELPNLSETTLQKVKTEIYENEKVKKVVTTFTNKMLQDIVTEKIASGELKQDIKDLIVENKTIIERELGKQLPNQEIDIVLDKLDKTVEFDKLYQELVTSVKNDISPEGKKLIELYNWISSTDFQWILIGGILACILILAMLTKSFYKWLIHGTIACIISAIINIVLALAFSFIMNVALMEIATTVRISATPLLLSAAITFSIGIILLIAYLIIRKTKLPKEAAHDIS